MLRLDGRCGHRNVIPDDDLHAHALSTIVDADFLLFGAGTYHLLAEHWAQVAEEQSESPTINEFARTLAAKPKIVFSSTATPWPNWNSTVEDTDPTARVSELLEGGATKLVIQASPQLARTLRRAGLVDGLRLLMQPLVAGDGPALFEPDERHELTLTRDSGDAVRRGGLGLRVPLVDDGTCPGRARRDGARGTRLPPGS